MIYRKTALVFLMSLICMLALAATENIRYKPLEFVNPGNRRLLKTAAGNYYYFRALPEKSMTISVNGMESIQIRSISTVQVRKPQVIIIINKNRTTYDLKQTATVNGWYLYEPADITLIGKPDKIEILCYDREFYFRVYERIVPKPRPQTLPNLQIVEHGGVMQMNHNSSSSEYYSFEPGHNLRFNLNNKRTAVIYVRARLTDRSTPVLDLYRNNELVERIELSTARTTKYSVTGIKHLTVGKKIELPAQEGTVQYSLRSVSEHLFLARPVILKD